MRPTGRVVSAFCFVMARLNLTFSSRRSAVSADAISKILSHTGSRCKRLALKVVKLGPRYLPTSCRPTRDKTNRAA
jgi:hypothetical protein